MAKSDSVNLLLLAVILAAAFVAVINFSVNSMTGAATVSCNFVWPQEVVVDGAKYVCPGSTPYCYNPGAASGEAKCCKWSEASGYDTSSCVSVGPSAGTSPPTPVQSTNCEDTDSGKNYGVRGDVKVNGVWQQADYCYENSESNVLSETGEGKGHLKEFYCVSGGYDSEKIAIVSGKKCKSGTITDVPAAPVTPLCTDSDGGKNYATKGTTTGVNYNDVSKTITVTDSCVDSSTLKELRCAGREGDWRDIYVIEELHSCPCSNGVCSNAVCTSNAKQCDGSNLKTCKADGSGWTTEACQYGCDAATLSCKQAPAQPACTDSDNGKTTNTKGTTTGYNYNAQTSKITLTDNCVSTSKVKEYYCGGTNNKFVLEQQIGCSSGLTCQDGACKTPLACTDTDGGTDYYIKGVVTGLDVNGQSGVVISDECIAKDTGVIGPDCVGSNCYLWESFCDYNGHAVREGTDHFCENGCSNGACLKVACTDSDGGGSIAAFSVRGTITGFTKADHKLTTRIDYCTSTRIIMEYTCSYNVNAPTWVSSQEYWCPTDKPTCKDGACFPPCTDSDGGKSYSAKGQVVVTAADATQTTFDDKCVDTTWLTEYYCDGTAKKSETVRQAGKTCSNGALG